MTKQCANCGSQVNSVATVCPFCHLRPYHAYDKAPYLGNQDSGEGLDAGQAMLLLGMPVCLFNPVVGVGMMVGGVIIGLFQHRRGN